MSEKIYYHSLAELARELKITRPTLYKRLAEHEIDYADLSFTEEQVRLLRKRNVSSERIRLSPKEKHEAERLEMKENYEQLLATLRVQHEQALQKAQNTYAKQLENQALAFEKATKQLKKQFEALETLRKQTYKEKTEQLQASCNTELEYHREKIIDLHDQLNNSFGEIDQLAETIHVLSETIQHLRTPKPRRYPKIAR